jgi:hypothetical protein
MSLDYPTLDEARKHPWGRWTPQVIKVLATAKAIAGARARIDPEHLFLAFESVELEIGDRSAWPALERVGIRPSLVLGRPAPSKCPRNRYIALSDFGPALSSVFPTLVIEEAKAMGDDYVGTEHLLLFLARVGVPGVDLSYEQIRKIILELRAPAILHARHASASEAGDYFQVIFEEEADAEGSRYLLIQRQFEFPDAGCCAVETEEPHLCGHFQIQRARLERTRFQVWWSGGSMPKADVTFETDDESYQDICRIMRIMVPQVQVE